MSKLCPTWQILHFNLLSKLLLVWLTDKSMHTWACSCTATVRKFIFSAVGKLKVEYFIFICVQQGFWYQQDWIFVSCCKSVQSVPGFAPDFDSLIFARCELTLRVRFCPAFGFVLPLGLSGIAELLPPCLPWLSFRGCGLWRQGRVCPPELLFVRAWHVRADCLVYTNLLRSRCLLQTRTFLFKPDELLQYSGLFLLAMLALLWP